MVTSRTKDGLQAEIRQLTEAMNRTCKAMRSLPACPTKDQFGDKVVQYCVKINDLINDLTEVNSFCCWYGFTRDVCPGGICGQCVHTPKSSTIRWD